MYRNFLLLINKDDFLSIFVEHTAVFLSHTIFYAAKP